MCSHCVTVWKNHCSNQYAQKWINTVSETGRLQCRGSYRLEKQQWKKAEYKVEKSRQIHKEKVWLRHLYLKVSFLTAVWHWSNSELKKQCELKKIFFFSLRLIHLVGKMCVKLYVSRTMTTKKSQRKQSSHDTN